ncbi:MAG: hypothetical protein WAN51_03305 [Alphaproteobacteria bacterium]
MKHRIKRSRFPADVPISDRVAQAIGHAVVEWGRLEDLAGVVTACLLQADHREFRSVTANMTGKGKFDTLWAVALLKMPRRKAATIGRIVEAAKGLSAERNRIVHGCWIPTGKINTAQRHSFRANLSKKTSRFRPPGLMDIQLMSSN